VAPERATRKHGGELGEQLLADDKLEATLSVDAETWRVP